MARPQGNLNRLRANIQINSVGMLSITNDQLGPEGIRLSFESNATDLLPTMAGMVSSPRPYQECTLTIAVVKSMPIGDLYKTQFERSTLLGAITVFPDVATGSDVDGNPASPLSPFMLQNMALENIREMSFAGNQPTLEITMRGYYEVNQDYFSGN